MPTLQAMRRQILGLMTSSESLTEARAADLLDLFELATTDDVIRHAEAPGRLCMCDPDLVAGLRTLRPIVRERRDGHERLCMCDPDLAHATTPDGGKTWICGSCAKPRGYDSGRRVER